MLEACALKPPILPATAEPYKFLLTFKSTRSRTLVLRTLRTTDAGTTASHTTDLPRPSTLETITQSLTLYCNGRDTSLNASTINYCLPIDGAWFLVGAYISTKAEYLHVTEPFLQDVERTLGRLRQHVHAHGVAAPLTRFS